jgi:hypothetical protein
VYAAEPRGWDDSEVTALQTYAGVVASLLGAAAKAQVKGALADQLQTALDSRAVIERGKGALMERECLDEQEAFTHLRRAARSSGRKLTEVAREVAAGLPLPRVGRARSLQAPSRVRARPAPRDPRLEAEVWATRGGVARPCPPISARMRLNHPDDHADDPSGALWSDGASNVSRLDPSGAAWVDAEHPSPNRKVLGSNPTPGLHIFSI